MKNYRIFLKSGSYIEIMAEQPPISANSDVLIFADLRNKIIAMFPGDAIFGFVLVENIVAPHGEVEHLYPPRSA